LRVTLACLGAVSLPVPGVAQQRVEARITDGSAAKAGNQSNDAALLNALLARRAAIVRSPGTPQSKDAALTFMDTRIKDVQSRLRN